MNSITSSEAGASKKKMCFAIVDVIVHTAFKNCFVTIRNAEVETGMLWRES